MLIKELPGAIPAKIAAEMAGVTQVTIRNKCAGGKIPGAYKEAGKWMVPATEARAMKRKPSVWDSISFHDKLVKDTSFGHLRDVDESFAVARKLLGADPLQYFQLMMLYKFLSASYGHPPTLPSEGEKHRHPHSDIDPNQYYAILVLDSGLKNLSPGNVDLTPYQNPAHMILRGKVRSYMNSFSPDEIEQLSIQQIQPGAEYYAFLLRVFYKIGRAYRSIVFSLLCKKFNVRDDLFNNIVSGPLNAGNSYDAAKDTVDNILKN
jgi:hypothetical protein